MTTRKQVRLSCGLGLLAALLAGCSHSAPPAAVQTPASSPQMNQAMHRDMVAPSTPVPKAHN